MALRTLRAIGQVDHDVLDAVARCLPDPDSGVKIQTIETFCGLSGAGVPAAASRFWLLLKGSDARARSAAVKAIAQLTSTGDPHSFAVVSECLKDCEGCVRAAALQALTNWRKMSDAAEKGTAREVIIQGLKDSSATVREKALELVGRVIEEPNAARATLRRVLAR
jgi:HEAT repeat protein